MIEQGAAIDDGGIARESSAGVHAAITYAAHLVAGEPDDLVAATRMLEELVEGYGDRPHLTMEGPYKR